MNQKVERLKQIRGYLLNLINELTPDQLNDIPEGFNNNIIWNLGHLVITQQTICYHRSGLPLTIDEMNFETFKPGMKPDRYIGINEIGNIKELLLSRIDRLDDDYQNNIFISYTPWTSRYGVKIATIDDIIDFLLFHEGLHIGYVMALKHAIRK
jgi:DinB superfamily